MYLYYITSGSVVKNLPTNAVDVGSVPELGRSLEKEMATATVFLPGKSHGQRRLVGPWGRKRARHKLVTKQQHKGGKLHFHKKCKLLTQHFSLFGTCFTLENKKVIPYQ